MGAVTVRDLRSLAAEPWKNGGGVTRTVAMKSDQWRVSVAEISRDGSFSRFEGIDRTSLLLQGAGVRLTAGSDSVDFSRDIPAHYDGSTSWVAELTDGPVTVLNVMCRSGNCKAMIELLNESIEISPAATVVVFGPSEGCSIVADDLEHPVELLSGEVCVVEPSEACLQIYRSEKISRGDQPSPCVVVMIFSDDEKLST